MCKCLLERQSAQILNFISNKITAKIGKIILEFYIKNRSLKKGKEVQKIPIFFRKTKPLKERKC